MLNLAMRVAAMCAALSAVPAAAQSVEATRFGQREAVQDISLSPDGTRVLFLAPGKGRDTSAFVATIGAATAPLRLFGSDGDPEQLNGCRWASNTRVICQIYVLVKENTVIASYTRWIALDADGKNPQLLSARTGSRSLGVAQTGGEIIDWQSDKDGSILMTRAFVPDMSIGTRLASAQEGYGVERVDTRTLQRTTVEAPKPTTVQFISDGHGEVRIMASAEVASSTYDRGMNHYFYRKTGSRAWLPLSVRNVMDETGFLPVAIDRERNAVYGFDKANGRDALFRIALDGSLTRELVLDRPDVDIDNLITVGRQQRVVGVSYAAERREALYFDPALKALAASLGRALPGRGIRFVDASEDETRLLLWAGSDVDSGRYYRFDRTAKKLEEIMLSRPPLETVKLATVKPVTFAAADGTQVPGYLTLPPGSDGKNLPAIVMPHGGPAARDEWGFDWLAQFYAARGYAVLQPNFRGSSGYGEGWFVENGFQSWRIAIGDINDGGRWLVSQGIADPGKLAIVGWSYGGYAALQSGVLAPGLFKAIVAVAPVTDLGVLKEQSRYFTSYRLASDYIGSGPHIQEGSPARNAGKITAPVLMFHGDLDANVDIEQARLMESRLKGAGKRVELVQYHGLDHQLPDGTVRTQMLDKSDAFLREAMGIK